MLLDQSRIIELSHELKLVILVFQSRANSDAGCSLYLVTCEHPYLNPCRFERFNGNLNIRLELVLNTSDSQEFQIGLKLMKYCLD